MSRPPMRRDVQAILPGLLIALLLSSLSQGTVLTALSAIGRDLGQSDRLPWLLTAFLVASTVTIPLFGKLADIWGRRTILLAALGIFVAGSAACALAPSMSWLIAGRAVQGAGGGALISLCLTVMADVIPPSQRARYQILISSFFMIGNLGGPVVGGLIVQHLAWPVVFWLNVPLGLIAMALCFVALRALPQHHRRHPLDIPGALLLTATTILLLLAINGGGRPLWITLTMVAMSVALWAVFGWWLLRSPSPLIALHLLRNPIIRNSTLAIALGAAALLAITAYLPLYVQTVIGLSPSRSGIALLPLILGTTAGGTFASQMMPHYPRYRRIGVAGMVLAAVSMVAMGASVWLHAPLRSLEVLSFLAGVGIGCLPPITTISAQNAAALHELGTVTAANNYFRQLFSAVLVAALGALLAGAGIKSSVEGGVVDLPALVGAFTWVCLGAAAFTVAGLAFLLRMTEQPLRTSHGPEP